MAEKKIRGNREPVKSGYVFNSEGEKEPYYVLRSREMGIEMSFTQYYHWTIGILCKLNPCESDLIQYLSVNMDKSNQVIFIKHHKKEFCEKMMRKDGNPKYTIRTVDNALLGLKEIGMIRELDKNSRGVFVVNPKYFFKDNPDKRLDMIKVEMVFEKGMKPKINVEAK